MNLPRHWASGSASLLSSLNDCGLALAVAQTVPFPSINVKRIQYGPEAQLIASFWLC